MIVKIFKLSIFITFEHVFPKNKPNVPKLTMTLKFLESLRIPRNSRKFSSVCMQFPILLIKSKDSFLQTWNYWEFLGILKNSHCCFHQFPGESQKSQGFLSLLKCICWNKLEFLGIPRLWNSFRKGRFVIPARK